MSMSDETEIIEESTPVTQMPTLEEQLAEAKASAAANLEGWQRTLAEFANARKRMEKQRTEAYTNATTDTLSKLLPIIDDFNLLDARGAISVTERAAYIGRIRNLARAVAQAYLDSRARLGFPMAPKAWAAEVLAQIEKKAA